MARTPKTTAAAPTEKFLVLTSDFEKCYCSELHDTQKAAVDDGLSHYDEDDADVIYVVKIVKTIRKGPPKVDEGYVEDNG